MRAIQTLQKKNRYAADKQFRNILKRIGTLIVLTISMVYHQSMNARVFALSINFNFGSYGANATDVTGVIEGLTAGATGQKPKDIIINNNPIEIPQGTILNNYINGTIDVDGSGNVTYVNSIALDDPYGGYLIDLNYNNLNYVFNGNIYNSEYSNNLGFTGVTYKPEVTSIVPWQGEFALIPLGSVVLLLASRCKKRAVSHQISYYQP